VKGHRSDRILTVDTLSSILDARKLMLVRLMDNTATDKTPKASPKPFLAVGPTLHYSHSNVRRCWLLALAVFCLSCLFWSKVVTGSFWQFSIEEASTPEFWRLGQNLVTGVSIFEYPWQVFVLGLLMGILSVSPILISQLMKFKYSLAFVLAVVFLANLPGFALCLLVSCFGAACRPLRFRSRYIAIALCTAPQLAYWGFFGGIRVDDPIAWGFSFTPWFCAWLDGLIIAAFVLGIGHYTRYRPGLVWIFTLVTLVISVGVFELTVGFDEMDYQIYVIKNNPEKISEFQDRSLTEVFDATSKDPEVTKYLGEVLFFDTEPTALRADLKEEIKIKLSFDQWPSWFEVPKELDYKKKRENILRQYDLFITKRPGSNRMPIALYFKALLKEYTPDVKLLDAEEEILHFYTDYPHRGSLPVWHRLYKYFPQSSESIEARWRISHDWAGQERFARADALLGEALEMVALRLEELEGQQPPGEALFSLFQPPGDSVMTVFKLTEVQRRLNQLRALIGEENREDDPGSIERLAMFVKLNPHSPDYEKRLNGLLELTEGKDCLRDNILLALAKLKADDQRQAELFKEVHEGFPETDGGMMALYELGHLQKRLYQDESNSEQQKKHLAVARETLERFLELYPSSSSADQVKEVLAGLPAADKPK